MPDKVSICADVSGGTVGVAGAQHVHIENQYVGAPPPSARGVADLGIARIFQTRTRAFTDEYLASETGPVPFGGRDQELSRLDEWLFNPKTPPRMLVTAPAGRGKSALLVRWLKNLQEGGVCSVEGWQLAFVPISIRTGTNRPEVFYEALARRLAEIAGVSLPTEALRDGDGFRYAVRDQLDQLASEAKPRALIVIDGIDEALEGSFDAGVLPSPLPANVRVLLSARWQLGDHNSDGWLKRLGWDRGVKVDAFELDRLGAKHIADVVVKLGAPLDVLVQEPGLVERLVELTEGEPLLVRYYAEDLWTESSKGARIGRIDLELLKPGFDSYFKRWFELQERLWKDENRRVDLREVDAVLSILAFALGPLGEADLLSVMERIHGVRGVTAVDRLLEPLRRWVFGNGKCDTEYVLSHPRIGEYLQRSRFAAVADRLRRGFADWSKEHCVALNEGRLAPEQASPYCLQFLPEHLKQIRACPDVFMLMVEDGWRSSWEKFEGGHRGFSSAVQIAFAALREGASERRLGSRWRCALTLSSIRSLGEKVPTELALAAVKKGVLTVRQAAYFAEMKGASEAGVRLLIGLSSIVSENLRLSAELRHTALSATNSIRDERERVTVLGLLIPHLSQDERHKALSEALRETRNYDDHNRVHLLQVLTPHLLAEQAYEAINVANAISSEEHRATALVALVRRLPKEVSGAALAALVALGNPDNRERALSELVPYLTPRQQEEALIAAKAVGRGDDVSRAMSGFYQHRVRGPDMGISAKASELDYVRSGTLFGLHQYLTQAQKEAITSQVLTKLRADANEYNIAGILQTLAPHLVAGQIGEAFAISKTIKNDKARVEAFASLAPYLNSGQLNEVLSTFDMIGYGSIWLEIIAKLTPYLGSEQLSKAVAASRDLKDELDCSKALSALAPYLPPDQVREALGAAKAMEGEIHRVNTISALAPHLSFEQLYEALAAVKTVGSEPNRSKAMIALASFFTENEKKERQVLRDAVKDAVTISIQPARSLALAALASSHLSPQEKSDVLKEALALAEKLKGEPNRSLALIALAPQLPTEERAAVLRDVLTISKSVGEDSRSKVLAALASSLTPEQLNEALADARALEDESHRSRALIALAPYLRPKQIGPLFGQVHPDGKTQLMAVLVPFIAPEHRRSVFEETLASLEAIGDQQHANADAGLKSSGVSWDCRLQLLVALAPYLAPEQLDQALITARGLRWSYYRSKVLAALAPHLDEKVREQAVGDALMNAKEITDKSQQTEVLAQLLALIPCREKLDSLLALVDAAADSSRWVTLSAVQACAAPVHQIEGEEAILQLCRAVKDTCHWFP